MPCRLLPENLANTRSSHSEVFFWKGVLKICSKFTGDYPCRSAISIKLQSNFIETILRHGRSPANLLHSFRTAFLKNTSEWLLPKHFIFLYHLTLCLFSRLFTISFLTLSFTFFCLLLKNICVPSPNILHM